MNINFEAKNITQFMEIVKKYFEPISNLINFNAIETYLYSELIGDIEDDDLTMDFIFTLIDFMVDSQERDKEETFKFYNRIKDYTEHNLEELELQKSILNKRIETLEKGK